MGRGGRSRQRSTEGAVTETLWPDSASLADATAVAAELIDALIDRLLAVPPGLEARVYDAMRYSALAPGKRLRPLLLLAPPRLFRVPHRTPFQPPPPIHLAP